MKNMLEVGIIIVNYNGSDLTIDCINSLYNSTFTDFQIYVIDNGSEINEITKLKKFCEKQKNITLIDTRSNNGIAVGNNIGIEAALKDNCKYIMFLNNDTIVDNCMVENLISRADKGAKLCTPLMFYHDNPNRIWCAGGKFNKFKGTTTHLYEDKDINEVKLEEKYVEYVPTCCLLVDSIVFKEFGTFDPSYFLYYDDTDFIYRLNKNGYKIKFVPTAKLWHKVSSSSGGSESKLSIYYLNRNRFYFIKKNFRGIQKIIAMIYSYLTRIIRMVDPLSRHTIYEAVRDYQKSNMGWKDLSEIKNS